jgi:hypothetical protein
MGTINLPLDKNKDKNTIDFLKKSDKMKIRNHYVRIVPLNWTDETQLEDANGKFIFLEGRVTGGTINVNGKSSVRRSGSISFTLENNQADITNIDNIISINKKIKIEIGFDNTIDTINFDPIVWIPMGVYIIKTASVDYGTNGISASISGVTSANLTA